MNIHPIDFPAHVRNIIITKYKYIDIYNLNIIYRYTAMEREREKEGEEKKRTREKEVIQRESPYIYK